MKHKARAVDSGGRVSSRIKSLRGKIWQNVRKMFGHTLMHHSTFVCGLVVMM